MPEATMTLNMTAREMAALTELAEHHDMSKTQVMRQALRLFQLVNMRVRAGERLYFSGDEKRAIEFVGLGFDPAPLICRHTEGDERCPEGCDDLRFRSALNQSE